MATLYEYYTVNNGYTYYSLCVNQLEGQTFTPQISHNLTSVKIYLQKFGSPTGNIYVSIRLGSGGKPTGGDLKVSSTSLLMQDVSTSYTWYEFFFDAPYQTLNASTQYAIVAKATGGDASTNFIGWSGTSSGTYTGGDLCYSIDNDSTWGVYAGRDRDFYDYGLPIATFIPQIIII